MKIWNIEIDTDNFKKFFFIVLIIVFIVTAAVLLTKGCRHFSDKKTKDGKPLRTQYVYLRDTVERSVLVPQIQPYKVVVPHLDTLKVTDTVEIMVDYFTERSYKYAYADTNLSFKSDIVVRENEIRTIRTDYQVYKEKVIVEKRYVQQPKFQLGIGVGMATDLSHADLEVGLCVAVRRNRLSFNYGIRDKRFSVGYSYNIISR